MPQIRAQDPTPSRSRYVRRFTHYFRLDKPLVRPVAGRGNAMLENFTRVENFGCHNVHWVEIGVDAGDPEVFCARPRTVAGNFFPR